MEGLCLVFIASFGNVAWLPQTRLFWLTVIFVHSLQFPFLFRLLTDKLLKPSHLAEMSVSGGAAYLTLPHLAKDDEGLYTLRIFTKDGTAEHSAYLFVSGRSTL